MNKYSELLEKTIAKITGPDIVAQQAAKRRLDSLTKPLGSLGRLEEIVIRIAGITGEARPVVDKKTIIIMCADNGVAEEGISSCPKSVTAEVTRNFTRGITGVNILSSHAGAEIVPVDIGVEGQLDCCGIVDKKIMRGTRNMAKGPAMTREEALRAIDAGIETVNELKEKGARMFGTGEMGVGNTTTSSAVAAVLTGRQLDSLVGRGAGLSSEGLEHKIEVIRDSILLNKPDADDAVDVLAKVGGLDIAGLAGCYLGAAACRIPIVIDGFIAGVAALVAARIMPDSREFMIASHGSAEPGSKAVLEALGLEPLLMLGLRLGEGTGAALAFHIIDAAFEAYNKMGIFGDANIEQYKPLT